MSSPLRIESDEPACVNCDDRFCMDCVLRYIHDECRYDCPFCCADLVAPAFGQPGPPQEAQG